MHGTINKKQHHRIDFMKCLNCITRNIQQEFKRENANENSLKKVIAVVTRILVKGGTAEGPSMGEKTGEYIGIYFGNSRTQLAGAKMGRLLGMVAKIIGSRC